MAFPVHRAAMLMCRMLLVLLTLEARHRQEEQGQERRRQGKDRALRRKGGDERKDCQTGMVPS